MHSDPVIEPTALEPDAQVIFLLCGHFGNPEHAKSVKPLTVAEYNVVADWLHEHDLRPGVLLTEEGRKLLLASDGQPKVTRDRIGALLRRGPLMTRAIEGWLDQGGWALARSEVSYPKRFHDRLQRNAPPVLWGIGPQELLHRGGLSIIASHDAGEKAEAFIRQLAASCVKQRIQIISGSIEGAEGDALAVALERGGTVVSVLTHGLSEAAGAQNYRTALEEGQLTLVSTYYPYSHFGVWKELDRNKHVYALSDGAFIAHSRAGYGAVWAGATENLSNQWVPLFVRAESPLPEGNYALIQRGGIPAGRQLLHADFDLAAWLKDSASATSGVHSGSEHAPVDRSQLPVELRRS